MGKAVLKIRTITIRDYDSVIAIWQKAGLTSLRLKGRDSKAEIKRQIARDPDLFLGGFIGERLVAVSVGSDDGRKGWINRLTVDPKFQRKGIATKMIKATEKALKKRGLRIICAIIEDWNVPSLTLFDKEKYVLHRDFLYLSKRESEDW